MMMRMKTFIMSVRSVVILCFMMQMLLKELLGAENFEHSPIE